ncbi:MAG: ketoacyl-ACP synthase III [Bdellovibrionaceae bacterium]|nr:ketoacyl-ACP synthase III [Pseudobdellovibrionaceae bacterium]
MYNSRISGTGSYLPEKQLTNSDIEKMVDTTADWIKDRTGISSRHVAKMSEATSDIGAASALKALEMAGLKVDDIDMIITATITPDHVMPNTACLIQQKIGARNVMSFDLSAACSGFIFGLSVADQFIRTGVHKNILVIGAEVLTRIVNYQDRGTCILFGDGGGAAIVSRAEENSESQFYSHHGHGEGRYGDLLMLPAGGSKTPFNQEALSKDEQFVIMKGRDIFKQAVRTMSECCSEALNANKMQSSDIDWLIPHQANLRIINAVAKHFDFPKDKVVIEIEDVGNTSAGTIPIALDRAVRDGRLQRGQNILLAAFGGGLTSGSLLFKY